MHLLKKTFLFSCFCLQYIFLFSQNASITAIEEKFKVKILYKFNDLPSDLPFSLNNCNTLNEAFEIIGQKYNLTSYPYSEYTYVLIKEDKNIDNKEYFHFLDHYQKENSVYKSNLIRLGDVAKLASSGKTNIKGKVKDESTDESIIGCTLYFGKKNGTVSNENGSYNIELPPGIYDLKANYEGYQEYNTTIDIQSDSDFDIILKKEAISLDEVTIKAIAKNASVQEVQVGVSRIDIKSLDRIPTLLGEKDVVKAILLNPGVSTIGEGATGYNVRGGNVDQNLMLLDDAILYNASHAMGFFSTFHSDLIRDASLYKGNIPASMGGRLASVLEVNLKEGNNAKNRIKASINPISAAFSSDGKLGDNLNYIVGGRGTFSSYIFSFFSNEDLKKSKANFYDFSAKLTYKLGKGKLNLSAYTSGDNFKFSDKFGFDYSTQVVQMSHNHIFNNTFSNKFALVYSKYNSSQQDFTKGIENELITSIDNLRVVEKVVYSDKKLKLESGLNSLFYFLNPGKIAPLTQTSIQPELVLEKEKALELAAFINLEIKLNKTIEIAFGGRINQYYAIGPKQVYQYVNNIPNQDSITGITTATGNFATYTSGEPRASLKFNLSKTSSFKMGLARTTQFVNQIFNADTPTPTNQWQLSNIYLKPNFADNLSAGVFKNFSEDNWETSIEAFYRKIGRLFDYKDFAQLIGKPNIETELYEGIGRAYGFELSIKKNKGFVNGWISYTYSATEQKINSINDGNWYRANYDKPHNFSFILNIQPKIRQTFTFNFNYSTGRPTTAPQAGYLTPENINIPIYSNRNQLRIPDYHRLDISYNLARTHNQAAKVITSWTFSIYNVYGRKNPFSFFYTRGFANQPQANQLSIVGTPIPSIRFNIEFI